MNATLIHHFLENSSRRFADKVALVHEEVRATYRQINSQANQLARFFIDQGLVPGDRIALLLENSLEYVVTYYAVLKAGAVAVPLNTELKADGLSQLLQEIDAEYLVSARKYERLLRDLALKKTSIARVIIKDPKLDLEGVLTVFAWDDLIREREADNLDLELSPDNLGSIIYTSGSTGRPKGAMLTHGNIVANVRSICQYLQLTDSDIQMVVQPFFYVMGKSLLNTHVAVGGRVVVNNKFGYPATVINQMIKEQVTGFSGVPSTYAYLLHRSPFISACEKLTSLRYCSQAGGHMARATKLKLLAILPEQTELVVMYGATEASARLAYVEPGMIKEKIDSIGKPIPGVSMKVMGDGGQELPVGEVGELVASGDNIMQGYWKNPEATQQALSEQGYHTGDLGYRDVDGYFFVTGRKDNQLKVGGHRINTQEIEDVIMASGLAVETSVIGVPDHLLGHVLAALVVPVIQEFNVKDLQTFCRQHLPSYKLPQKIQLVQNLPKNASGKVDKHRCQELIGKED